MKTWHTIAITILLLSRHGTTDSPRLAITYPPQETVTRYPRIRIAGSCDPEARVSIQGREVKVYPTGAFVGLVPLSEGKNKIDIAAVKGKKRESVSRAVICRDPLLASPVSPAVIDKRLMEPSAATVLQANDTLFVRMKGSPGARAFWTLGKVVCEAPMTEVRSDDESCDSVRGIYRGSYRIKPGDRIRRARVRFRLVSEGGEEAAAFSPGRVTLLPAQRLSRGEVVESGAFLCDEPNGRKAIGLDEGTRVRLCGEAGGSWRVKLSEEERYWIPKKSVKKMRWRGDELISIGRPSISRTGDNVRLSVPMSAPVPCRITGEGVNGWRVELFGVSPQAGEGRIEGIPPVHSVEMRASGPDGVCLILDTRGKPLWGYACRRSEGGLVLDIKRPPGGDIRRMTIVVDPGHGGGQPGAVSPTGLLEKELNLRVARVAGNFLKERGARVVMTRDGDETLSLRERIEKAREAGADLFVSVHHNSSPGQCDPLGRVGADTFYNAFQSKLLGERILDRLRKTGLKRNACRAERFAVILPTEYPSVLVECGYMSNPGDEALFMKEGFPEAAGRAIGRGIVDFVREAG